MLGRKVIYVRCINCSYNNVAKGIRLLDKKAFFCLYRKKLMQVRAFERYIPLTDVLLHTRYVRFAIMVVEYCVPGVCVLNTL